MRIFDRYLTFNFFTGGLAAVAVLMMVGQARANESAKGPESEKTGMLSHIITNCGNPNHKGPHYIPVLIEATSHDYTELDVSAVNVSGIEPGTYVKVRGALNIPLANDPLMSQKPVFRITGIERDVQAAAAAAAKEPDIANGPSSTDVLNCLLLFATTLDQTNYPASKITSVEDKMFYGSNNASNAIKSMTYEHVTLTHGDTVVVDLNINASDTSYSAMGSAMRTAASALGYNLGDYDRILHFCPQNTQNIPTAYGSKPGSYTWYSYGWSGGMLDGITHELGHNFGFSHAGAGSNQYGDESCAMGYSHSGNNTATYSAPKKAQKGWFDAYPGSFTSLTNDATFDIYPVSTNPDVTPGMRTVQIDGTTYYASYRRNLTPYGWCRRSEDRDRIIIQTQSGGGSSTREARILPGSSHMAGTTDIVFERYGDTSKGYATVSFDLDDGNTKPVADTQTISLPNNYTSSITLSGSDADSDPLTYAQVTLPANGSLSGTLPDLVYTPNTNYTGPDSFVFSVNDGRIRSFATVSITVEGPNNVPVANNFSETVYFNTPASLVLDATDADGHVLTYAFVSLPTNGMLSGTAPNLTYTADTNYVGSDSFTFYVSDPYSTSTTATVSLMVLSVTNTPPVANAGPDQVVVLVNNASPGLYFGTVAGNINTTTPNPETELLVDVASKTEDNIAGNTTEIFTGQIYDADGAIQFTEHIDDKARIWIDGSLVINNDSYNTRTTSGNLNLTPGWHDIEIRISNGGGGSGPNSGVGIGYDPTGGTSWQTLVDPGDASFLRVGSTYATANLAGMATDTDGTPLETLWQLVSGPGIVVFDDASATNATATFGVAGVYTLRLSADDGHDVSSNDVVITVNEPAGPTYTAAGTPYAWLQSFGITNDYENADLADLDFDGAAAWEEYVAGTDPTNSNSVFHIMSTPVQGGDPELVWYGTMDSGVTTDFIVYRCTNLAANAWVPVSTNARSASGTNTWIDTGSSGNVPAYYKIGIVQ